MHVSPVAKQLEELEELQQTTITRLSRRISYPVTQPAKSFSRQVAITRKTILLTVAEKIAIPTFFP